MTMMATMTMMSVSFLDLSNILRGDKVLLMDIRLHNLFVHNGKGEDETRTTQSPGRAKDSDIGGLESIDAPDDSGTSTLQRLIETGKVGKFSGFVGKCTH